MAATEAPRPTGGLTTSTAQRRAMPLSPHLQIWRFTPTMAASITQRATGVANMTGTALLAAWAVAAAAGPQAFAPVGAVLNSPIGLAVLFGYVWSLSFHLLGGLRYLYTDTGRGLAPATAQRAALGAFAGSFALAGLISALALAARNAA